MTRGATYFPMTLSCGARTAERYILHAMRNGEDVHISWDADRRAWFIFARAPMEDFCKALSNRLENEGKE